MILLINYVKPEITKQMTDYVKHEVIKAIAGGIKDDKKADRRH